MGLAQDAFNKEFPEIENTLQTHILETFSNKNDIVFDAIQAASPIQRFDNLMRFSIRVKQAKGEYHIYNFLGILKRSSLLAKNVETPLIHLKMDYIFKSKKMIPGSFDYNEVIRMFTAMPKFELFRTPKTILLEMVENILSITNPNNIQCFKLNFSNKNRVLFLITIPPYLFSQDSIFTIYEYLKKKIVHKQSEMIRITEDERYRLHIYFNLAEPEQSLPSPTNIEADISELLEPWRDKFRGHMFQYEGINTSYGLELINKYFKLIPSHYIARTHLKMLYMT